VTRLLLAIMLVGLIGCGNRDPVLTGAEGPDVRAEGDRFVIRYERENAGPLRSEVDQTGRFQVREAAGDTAPPQAIKELAEGWRPELVSLQSDEVGQLVWRHPDQSDLVVGRVQIQDGEAVRSRLLESGPLRMVVWVEQLPATRRLMLAALDTRTGTLHREILKDGVPEDCSPSADVIGPQLFYAYVRRGRLKTSLVRLQGRWFEEVRP